MGLDSLGQTTDAIVIDLNKDGLKDIYLDSILKIGETAKTKGIL